MNNEKLRFSMTAVCMPGTTFEEDLALLKEVGIAGYGLSEQKLGEGDELKKQAELFQESGLTATVCIPNNLSPLSPKPAYIYPGPEELDARIDLMCKSVDRLALFNPTCICFTTGSNAGRDLFKSYEDAKKGIKQVCQYAAEKNVKIALEACSHNYSIVTDTYSDFTWITTMQEALLFIEDCDEPNLGFCYDFYHVWNNYNIAELSEKYASKVYGAQISDYRDTVYSCDRRIPGSERKETAQLLHALEKGGFTGWYDCELFSDDGRWGETVPDSLWKLPVKELLEKCKQGFENVWNEAQKMED